VDAPRPVTQDEFRARVKHWAKELGFVRPWRVSVRFVKQGELIDPNDPECYAAHAYQPQYHRGTIYADLRHPGWEKEIHGLDHLIRHELAHGITSDLSQWAAHLVERFVSDEAVRKAMLDQLYDLEDICVNRIADIPALDDGEDDVG